MQDYTHFVGIDWSGAKGARQRGIAVAICEAGTDAPTLVTPERAGLASGAQTWSRTEVQHWLMHGPLSAQDVRAFVGIDAAFSLPFDDKRAYLPRGPKLPNAHALWRAVEEACAEDTNLYGGRFVDTYSDYFLRPDGRGERFERRFRVSEHRANERMSELGRLESPFHLVGPSQVGLAALSAMRMLHALSSAPGVAFWPFMPARSAKMVLVEVFATLFVRLCGHRGKIRDAERLNEVLAVLESAPVMLTGAVRDHDADALVTAAGLRATAPFAHYWGPKDLSNSVRSTEGWVFGVV